MSPADAHPHPLAHGSLHPSGRVLEGGGRATGGLPDPHGRGVDGSMGLLRPHHGQVAQLVEQGIENPRVGGSIPSLATTFPCGLPATGTATPALLAGLLLTASGSLAGCGASCGPLAPRCERVCCEVADALEPCIGPRLTWADVGARDRVDFIRRCRNDWDRARGELNPYEVQGANEVCERTRDAVAQVLEEGTEAACAELVPLYAVPEDDADTDAP